MKYDLLVISGGMLAVGIVIWGFSGHPNHAPRMHAAQEMKADPNRDVRGNLRRQTGVGCSGEFVPQAATRCGNLWRKHLANARALIGIKPPTAI